MLSRLEILNYRVAVRAISIWICESCRAIHCISERQFLYSVPTSGTIFGSALSYELFKPHIYIRKDIKSYGTQKKIEGTLEPSSKILFVDDVITTGHSILSGIESLTNQSVISGVVVLVDRQQRPQDMFDHFPYGIRSAIPILRIIKILNDNARIDKNEYDAIKEEIIEF